MCNTCKNVFKSLSSTTTTLVHLKTHVKQYSEYQSYSKKKNLKIKNKSWKNQILTKHKNQFRSPSNQNHISLNSAEAVLITQKISKMIVLDYQPYSIVEDRFRNLMHTLESKYVAK